MSGWGSHPNNFDFKHFLWQLAPLIIIGLFVVLNVIEFKQTIRDEQQYEAYKAGLRD